VDILLPPYFEKSGTIKPRKQAIIDGDWLGSCNLWVIQSSPVPAILYQQRSANTTWEPLKLDVSAGGHLMAGETSYDGLREAKEELGKEFQKENVFFLGRKLQVSPDTQGHVRHYVVDIFYTIDNSPLESFTLQAEEVPAVFLCPLSSLLELHLNNISFMAQGLTADKKPAEIKVTQDSFPRNWDNYHQKIAFLIEKYFRGESNLFY